MPSSTVTAPSGSEFMVLYLDKADAELEAFIRSRSRGMKLEFYDRLPDAEKTCSLAETDCIFTAGAKVDAAVIDRSLNLKFIQKTGAGYDLIDVAAAKARGIPVSTTPGANANAVAEYTIALSLDIMRKVSLLDGETKSGEWGMWKYRLTSHELRGKTHGILGMGAIGKQVAALSRAFGTKVSYFDKNRLTAEAENTLGIEYRDFESLLREADLLSVHLPLTLDTKGLLDDKAFSLMKRGAYLVNVSRGNIVSEAALEDALRRGLLAGAAIDVWEKEPAFDNALFAFPNVVASPHVAAGTIETLGRVMDQCFDNFERVRAGLAPLGTVTLA